MAHTFCTVSDCENESRQGRVYCEFHRKRFDRGQSLTAPKVERLSPRARLLEAVHRLADAPAEDDAEYEKRMRDLFRAVKQAAPSAHGELVRQGHAEARKRGVHIGRPREVDPAAARATVARLGSVTRAAEALRVSRPAIYRALARVTKDGVSLRQSRAA